MNTARRRPGAVVWLILVCGVVAALHVGKATIATPMLQADLHLSLGEAGWLTGIFAVLGLLGGAPIGAMVTAVGDRRTLLIGLNVLALAGLLGSIAPSYPLLLASRLAEGFGFLLIIVAGPALLQRLTTSAQRDIAFSLWSCFMPCGMAIAMLAGPLFPSWQSFWWSSAGFAAAAGMVAVCRVPRGASLNGHTRLRLVGDIRRLLSSRGTSLLAICFALYSLMFFALFSFLPILLMERMGVSHHSAGLLAALASAINASGNLAAGYLMARGAGRASLIAIAGGVMGVAGLGIFLGLLPAGPTFLLCIAFSAIGGLIPATLLASAPLLAPHAMLVPIAVGLIMQGSNLGQLLGPVAVGSATAAFGWSAAGVVVVVSAIAICITALLLRSAFQRSESLA
ncbi:MFS transporter [Stutzerimonas stutzeri]|uniref:MFS transporter n=1 Tax=Stutzerimonas stutzeri TaxID=316 RepID=W8R1K0_STUST|nr:MFS transporter [Stutzerimonas stutzeri]AHL76479.1 MFS transporter [Stutzerimonas stutzeri]MCQ4329714.1 MFS transporter [Stutzerimonas stutzeri]